MVCSENYFDDAGQYFTVFHGKNDTEGSDQSIDTLVHSYAPSEVNINKKPAVCKPSSPKQ